MSDTATREPAELRLLDVLLEEELRRERSGRAQPPSAPHRGGWLVAAAVLLLGIGVVLGVLLVPRDDYAAKPTNPQGEEREEIVPARPAELADLLPKLQGVVVTPSFIEKPHALYPGLDEWRSEDVDPTARASIANPVQLVQWMDALRTACGTVGEPPIRDVPPLCEVRLLLHGRRVVRLQLTERGSLQCGANVCMKVEGAVQQLLSGARWAADRPSRLSHGRAMDTEDLRLLPADLRDLTCYLVPAADLAALLPRFQQLERLRCYPRLDASVVSRGEMAGVVSALSGLPALRVLHLPANQVAACAHELAAVRGLEELALELPEAGPGAPARVSLAAPAPNTPSLPRAMLEDLPGVLAQLPRLRVLRLCNCQGLHVAITAVRESRLEQLHLDGSSIALDDLRALAAVASLRTLTYDLRANTGNDDETVVATLTQLRQLTQLRLLHLPGNAVPEQRLRAALPGCEVTSVEKLPYGYQFTPNPRAR